ncbi:MAG: Ig-like domain-containing protein, partial [bacterium]|nr:Ig-like domain-containing protein [bacterium]
MLIKNRLTTRTLVVMMLVGLVMLIVSCGTNATTTSTSLPTTSTITSTIPTTSLPTTVAPTTVTTSVAPTTSTTTLTTTQTTISTIATTTVTTTVGPIAVYSIVVFSSGDATVIQESRGTLQMSALVLPLSADDKTVVWSVINGSGTASISSSGLLSAITDGIVTVRATSASRTEIFGEMVITISNQDILVSSIAVSGAGSAVAISTFHGTLQMSALVLPANAADKSVVWSVIPGTGTASISSAGLLTAITNGTVTVKATSVSTPSINGTLVITLSNQDILVSSIAVS